MVTARHIDMDARMIWMSLRNEARAMTAAEVRAYWRPTFTDHQVVDVLGRLVAGKHLRAIVPPHRGERIYFVIDGCVPLPGFAVAAPRPPVGVLLA